MQIRAAALVGREREMDALRTAVDAARTRHGRAVFVVGEPGIGKTRLVGEVYRYATETGMSTVRGRTSTMGSETPFRPLAEVLLALSRRGVRPLDEIGAYRAVLGRLVPDWRDAGQPVYDDPPVVLAEGVLRLLSVVGGSRGALVVLEDLHDADAETLAAVEYLADNLAREPVTLVCTVRSAPGNALDLAEAATRQGAATRLMLDGLERPDIGRMVASCLGAEPGSVPATLVDRMWRNTSGNPFMVEELLRAQVDSGSLKLTPSGWTIVGTANAVPRSVARGIAQRTARLGPRGQEVLRTASLLGERFPLALIGSVTGIDDDELRRHATAGAAAQLIVCDEERPDWYAFAHPLTAQAMRSSMTPGDRVAIATRVADGIEELYPGLPGEWCQKVAHLRLAAGERSAAAELFTVAGQRALATGVASSAAALLELANDALAESPDLDRRATVLGLLLGALGQAGGFTRAFELAAAIDDLAAAGAAPTDLAALRTTLAEVARLAGWWSEGLAEVRAARELLGENAADEPLARLNATAAELTLDAPGADRLRIAEKLARTAIDAAESAALPAVAAGAWQVLGLVLSTDAMEESSACFARVARLATEHGLPMDRLSATLRLASNTWLATGQTDQVRDVLRDASESGAILFAWTAQAMLALDAVLRGRFQDSATLDTLWAEMSRLKITGLSCYVLVVQATAAAHRGRRREMEEALARFRDLDGEQARELSLAHGLAEAFCALLEEDSAGGRRALRAARAAESANPTTFHLSGEYGIELLLGALDGDLGWPEHHRVANAASGRLPWNRQFVEAAEAVLIGRDHDRDPAEADSAFASAMRTAAPYPTARHLILRLVAPAAHAAGWGEPVTWARGAEDFFFRAGVPAPANACRALLRRMGAPVPQRRRGTGQIPTGLRTRGVTAREYEVLGLLAQRWSNKEIAAHLHISLRTVEHHVASLLAKTGHSSRSALYDHPDLGSADTPTTRCR